jgi:diguanylate cyclase (GGDEF)-like protein
MTVVNLWSITYPSEHLEQLVYEARADRFFHYSISNMMGLIYGALLISLVLYAHETTTQIIITHFVITALIALGVFILSIYVKNTRPSGLKLQRMLLLRIFFGCCIGLMYGIACFLLPTHNLEIGMAFLVLIYIASISVAILQYSVMPVYYILFNLSVYIPLFYAIATNSLEHGALFALLLISGMVFFISKGLKVSVSEVNSIVVNLELQEEVSEHKVTKKKLQEMALYDHLTKVANRHLFKQSAEACLERVKLHDRSMALLYVDLNNFKYINDHYGHSAGDQLLIKTAELIRAQIRSSDLVARIGGDEFVIILENYDNIKMRMTIEREINESLNKEVDIDGHKILMSASIGCASYPNDGDTIEELLNSADRNMYEQKQLQRESACS